MYCKDELHWTVYAHILKSDNRRIYIGITGRKPEVRWRNGEGYTHCTHFYNAIKKYGFDAFNHVILADNLTQSDAENIEIYLINLLRKAGLHLYNMCSGGKAGDYRKGHHNTPEHNAQISKANKGRKLNLSESQRESRRQRCLNKQSGWFSKEGAVSPFTYRAGKLNNRAHPVYVFDIDWNLIDYYDTIKEASQKYKIGSSAISACCRGRLNKTHGYRFSYYKEDKRALLKL